MDKHCIGKKFRCKENNYIMKRGVICMGVKMIPMKRKSCPGCEKCGWIEDDIAESMSINSPPIIDEIVDGGVYEVKITNVSRDWETGYVDDYDIKFVLVEQERE